MDSEDTGPDPPKRDVRNHILFEIATEVANRVGGIYSVLKSKAPVTTAEYGDRYTLIGPLNRASAAVEVEELTLEEAYGKMEEGLICDAKTVAAVYIWHNRVLGGR